MATLDRRIGLNTVRALNPGEWVWDGGAEGVGGFYARRQRSVSVTYGVAYRTAEGRQRFHTIGRHGAPWTPDTARDEARRILGRVVDGADPAADKRAKRNADTVSELCEEIRARRARPRGAAVAARVLSGTHRPGIIAARPAA